MKNTKNVRGASYPVIDLEKAVNLIDKILKAVGKANASKLDIAKAAGYGGLNGKSRRVVAALGQYELITGAGDDYKLSSLALDILFPESEQKRRDNIAFAAQSPSLFGQLIENYKGDTIPGLLPNILVNKYGINPKFGNEVAKIFRSTLEFASLVDGHGVINYIAREESSKRDNNIEDSVIEGSKKTSEVVASDNFQPSTSSQSSDDTNKIEIILREGVKARIYVPYNLNQEEKNKLKSMIDLL